jgi:hypothetical protein
MAQHIDSVAGSSIPKVSRAQFIAEVRSGDLLFVSGEAKVSELIESETKSPWSHIAQLWVPEDSDIILALESTIENGVSAEDAKYYLNLGDGPIVLARRPELTADMHRAVRSRMLAVLGEKYDWQQEVEEAVSRFPFLHSLPVHPTRNEEYCSSYQWYGSQAVPQFVLQHPERCSPTPEDNWTDPSVVPICALVQI